MINSLKISSFFTDGFTNIVSFFGSLMDHFENFLYTADNVHILATTLFALIFVSVFFAVIFVVFKITSWLFGRAPSGSVASSFSVDKNSESGDDGFEEELSSLVSSEQENIHERSSFINELNEREEDYKEIPNRQKEKVLVELDWQKTKKTDRPQEQQQEIVLPPLNLKKTIRELISMIVNMLGRNVDELKIAQTLMYRSKDDLSEESIIQLVQSVKQFVTLCNAGAFDNLRKVKDLPDDEEALLRLLKGDTSYAMALIEALMDEKINQAVVLKNTLKRNALFKEASLYACCFGTLAETDDPNLAIASFELAVETYPENVLAWSRCADLYKQAGLEEKANAAYRRVLSLARQGENSPQQANARKYLSQYLYAQGDSTQAADLYLQSKNYYDSIGIHRPLDRKELEIIALLDNTASDNILHAVLHPYQNAL